MHSLRPLFVVAVFCLILGATAVSATERPAAMASGPEVNGIARILGHLQALLSVVWEKAACEIDPADGSSARTSQDDSDAPGTDAAIDIDPFG